MIISGKLISKKEKLLQISLFKSSPHTSLLCESLWTVCIVDQASFLCNLLCSYTPPSLSLSLSLILSTRPTQLKPDRKHFEASETSKPHPLPIKWTQLRTLTSTRPRHPRDRGALSPLLPPKVSGKYSSSVYL